MVWFEKASGYAFKYNSTESIRVNLFGSLNITGANNTTFKFYIRVSRNGISGAGGVYEEFRAIGTTTGGTGRSENVPLFETFQIEKDNLVELWVSSNSTSPLTLETDGMVTLQ